MDVQVARQTKLEGPKTPQGASEEPILFKPRRYEGMAERRGTAKGTPVFRSGTPEERAKDSRAGRA